MTAAPLRRRIIVPAPDGTADVFIDDPAGLVWQASWKSLEDARACTSNAVVVNQLWDAPRIDPDDDPSAQLEFQAVVRWIFGQT